MSKTELIVDYDNYVTNLGGKSPDDEWSRDSTRTDWTVNGVKIGKGYQSLYLDGNVAPGDTVWLVWAVWSDGDSFGHDENSRIEFITVHRYEQVARHNAQLLSKVDAVNNRYGTKVKLLLDDGTVLPYTVPWLGCFESLSYIGCEPFTISSDITSRYRYLPANKQS